jgi:nicotinamide-nucleotide amidase
MPLETRVVDALRSHGLTLACAESCTGGLFGARLTRVAGAGDVFFGGVICYQDAVKAELLRVDRETLARHGAVSREVARQMAAGARELFAADLAVSITGFAGPSAPPGGELGRVHVALAHWGGIESHELHFPDEREKVREGAVEEALRFVLEAVPRVVAGRN